ARFAVGSLSSGHGNWSSLLTAHFHWATVTRREALHGFQPERGACRCSLLSLDSKPGGSAEPGFSTNVSHPASTAGEAHTRGAAILDSELAVSGRSACPPVSGARGRVLSWPASSEC